MHTLLSVVVTCGYTVAFIATVWVWYVAGSHVKEKRRMDPQVKTWGLSFISFCNTYLTPKEKRIFGPIIIGGCTMVAIGEIALSYLK
jgi:hypothetical protein